LWREVGGEGYRLECGIHTNTNISINFKIARAVHLLNINS